MPACATWQAAAVTSTRLQRDLATASAVPRSSALEAFLFARRRFLARERVDMTAIAEALNVNRVTLYRWVGSRDQLLVEVIWSLARRTLDDVEASVREPAESGSCRWSPASWRR